MKKTIFKISLIIIFLSTIFLTSARVPLVREGVEWGYCAAIREHSEQNNGGFIYYRLQFKGDTILGGKSYKKLYRYETDELDTTVTPCVIAMREEGNKIYAHYTAAIIDYLNNRNYDEWYLGGILEDYGGPDGCLVYQYSDDGDMLTIFPNRSLNYKFTKYASPVMVGDMECEQYAGGNHICFISGVGPVNTTGSEIIGNLFYPIIPETAGAFNYSNYLLYLRELGGEIIYKSSAYDEFADGDATVNGVGAVTADRSELLSVEHLGGGRMLVNGAPEGSLIEAYDTQGRTVATSHTGIVTLPTPGLYIIRAGSQVVKVRF